MLEVYLKKSYFDLFKFSKNFFWYIPSGSKKLLICLNSFGRRALIASIAFLILFFCSLVHDEQLSLTIIGNISEKNVFNVTLSYDNFLENGYISSKK